jgi:hypothetical protein
MLVSFLIWLQAAVMLPNGGKHNVLQLLDDWGDDAFDFGSREFHVVPQTAE